MFVLDASAALSLVFDEDELHRHRVESAFRVPMTAIVPRLFVSEVANAILVACRRRRITNRTAKAHLHRLSLLPVIVSERPVSAERLVTLGIKHGLSAYDATYLDLALFGNHQLLTFDSALRNAAAREGVSFELS